MHQKLEIQKLSQKIVKSSHFANSPTARRLLEYLADCSLREEVPKETTIAIEVFGKDADFNPGEDTLVRVHVYQLRKKLKAYYESEGKEDEYQLRIPKGSYQVHAEPQSPVTILSTKKPLNWVGKVTLSLFTFIGGIAVALAFFLPEAPPSQPEVNPIWEHVLDNPSTASIVFGDVYVFQRYDSSQQKYQTLRDSEINSREDFLTYRDRLSVEEQALVQEMNYSFTIKNSVYGLQQLAELFHPAAKPYQIRMASSFDLSELYDHDVMYVGLFKTLGVLEYYLANSALRYDVKEGLEQISVGNGAEALVFQSSGSPEEVHTDYGWFAKFPGPNEQQLFLFAGFHDTGVMQSVRMLTEPALLKNLKEEMLQQLGEVPEYFEGIVEVQGINRTELHPTLTYIRAIELD